MKTPNTARGPYAALWLACLLSFCAASCGGENTQSPAPAQTEEDKNENTGDKEDTPDAETPDAETPDAETPDAETPDAETPDAETAQSPGCGNPRQHASGGVHVVHSFSEAAGGERGYYLSVPDSYDPNVPQRLIVGYAGTNWVGEQIQPYLALETVDPQPGEIYVYPDLKWRDFEGWGNLGGWLLGPHASPAHGTEDLEFTRELLDKIGEEYCIDRDRVFATGHSWGGDMAAVVACFLGDQFTAVAPAAANRPYWFEPDSGEVECVGDAAVWTFFGQNETHFTWQDHPGQFGDEQNTFWKAKHACDATETPLEANEGECVSFEGCTRETRYCYYGPASGHQIPDYFSDAVMTWFRSF